MSAFITSHPIASIALYVLAIVIVGLALKGLDDWFKARRAFDRLKAFDAKLDAIAKRVGL